MNGKSYPKLNTFTLTLVASGLLGLVGGCPPPDICALGFGAPTANAGAEQSVEVGHRVRVDGNASTGPSV